MKSAQMKPQILILLVLSVFAPIRALNINKFVKAGPIGPINIYKIGECTPDVNSVDMKIELGESDGHKDASFAFNLPFEVNEETYVDFKASKWENNAWLPNFFQSEGRVFDFVEKFIPDMWTHARGVAVPEITEARLVPPGTYEIKHFVESPNVLTVKDIFYGRFRSFVTLSDDEHDEFLCITIEFEALQP